MGRCCAWLKQAALAAERFDTPDSTFAAYGRFTGAPATSTNVRGRDSVGVPSEATPHTPKTCLRHTIARVDESAGRTGSTGVVRIDVDHRYAGSARFVCDELTQLTECPAMQRGPLGLPNRDALADALQIFQGDAASGALSLGHDAFAERVVYPSAKTSFFLAATLEQPAR